MIFFIVFLPLLAAIFTGLFTRSLSSRTAQFITCACLIVSAIFAAKLFVEVVIGGDAGNYYLLQWLDVLSFQVKWSLKIDSLTAVMLVVVTTVSALVHIYSIGYMSHDPHIQRFMSYLSLFTFFMLMLVTSDNFIQLFLGWEGVGLCSYLLIGFWYKKESANNAAMKAFIVNRVGDFGFALGIFTIFLTFGSLDFDQVFAHAAHIAPTHLNFLGSQLPTLDVICVLLFIGSMGKSAQLGLHTWLPDAMEGPTPVSALIHAATMVTAGVFLVARCSPLFEYAPFALQMMTIVGAVTCVFAATIALTQNDIKKIIAYSTCSQLGYMFFACGVSAYHAGIFHLMTHAFFKALLFLGAGSVIHAMSGQQDINKMGGIWKKIPFTYVMMWIGSLALAGIYPFAGYFSKDAILESAYAAGNSTGHLAFWFGIIAAFCTAFYSWRLLLKTFHGKKNFTPDIDSHIHESPLSMTLPLFVLSIGALLAGYCAYHYLAILSSDLRFWHHAITIDSAHIHDIHHLPDWVKLAPSYAGIAGIALAYICYSFVPSLPTLFSKVFSPLYQLFYRKYFIDELYDKVLVKPALALGMLMWKAIDTQLIDGYGPSGMARLSARMSALLSRAQTGYLYHYSFVMLVALVGLISWYIIGSI